MLPLGISPQSDYGRMFQKQQRIANLSGLAHFDQRLLQTQRCGVINRSELDNGNQNTYMLIAMPSTLLAASSMASDRVGWAWMVHIRS